MTAGAIPKLLRSGELRITVMGLGRIGLPTAALFAKAGARVTGVDIRREVVDETNAGRCILTDEPGLPEIVRQAVKEGTLRASLTPDGAISSAQFVIICVPTPVDETKSPDYSAIEKVSHTVGKSMKKGSVVIVESTIGPGIAEELVLPILESESGNKGARDFGLVSCPERSDPGNIVQNMKSVPRIVGGLTKESTNTVASLYGSVLGVKTVKMSNPRTANAVKLTENLFRDVNIALANEFALLYEKLGVDAIEVINACATKYNFMPHYPGIGVGGPCLARGEFVFLATDQGLQVTRLGEFVDGLARTHSATSSKWGATEFLVPRVEIQTPSLAGKQPEFHRVLWFSKRRYDGKMMKIRLTTNRYLTVTPEHPMLVKKGEDLAIRAAAELQPGDEVPLSNTYAPLSFGPASIDLIDELKKSDKVPLSQVKIKPLYAHLRSHRMYFTKGLRLLGVAPREWADYFRWNYLYLDKYTSLEAWQPPPIRHEDVALYTARGHTCLVPAVYLMDAQFWRFVGYYISEGCVTAEKTRRGSTRERVKISFGQHERDLIDDCRSILDSWGIKPDEEIRDGSHSLKFSSRVFAFLILDVLKCGHDSYTKRVPPQLFSSNRPNIASFLQGLFRGDGHLEVSKASNRSMSQQYATSSPELFQGVLLLLQAFSIVPTCGSIISKKTKVPASVLNISRYEDFACFDRDVGGLPKLALAMTTYYRRGYASPAYSDYKSYGAAFVRGVEEMDYSGYVYNMEVEGSHTFVTSYGVITHNCLPSNSYYLISEGIKAGNIPYIIRMAREINDRMPDHVVELVGEALNEAGKTVRGSRVAVLGVAYKPNVKDIQLTPVERLVTRLKQMGADIRLYDPMFKGRKVFGIAVGHTLKEAAEGTDCLVIGTAHDEFKTLDLGELSRIVRKKAALVDSRNVVSPAEAVKAGFAFRGVGRGF